MAKEKRRSWLDKISKWILDALPGEKGSAPSEPPSRDTTPASTVGTQPAPWPEAETQPKQASPGETPLGNGFERLPQRDQLQAPRQERVATPVALIQAPPPPAPSAKTIKKAWQAFEQAWSNAGLSDHYFLKQEDLHQTLDLLDRSFEEELIEWLFQLCTNPDALRDLAGIIERGQVRPTDNIDAIRAFAYVSVAVITRTRPIPVPPTISSPLEAAPTEPEVQNKVSTTASSYVAPSDQPLEELTDQLTDQQAAQQADNPIAQLPRITHPEEIAKQSFAKTQPSVAIHSDFDESGTQTILNIPIEDLELSIRSYNCLKRADIHWLLDLAGKTEDSLIEIKNFGQKSADEVREALARRGLPLPFQRADILGSGFGADGSSLLHSDDQDDKDDLKTLGLSPRTLNCLYRGKIYSVAELCRKTKAELLSLKNLGQTVLSDIDKCLEAKGLGLADEKDYYSQRLADAAAQQEIAQQLEDSWLKLREQAFQQKDPPVVSYEDLMLLCADNPDDPACVALSELLQVLNATSALIRDTLVEQYLDSSECIGLGLQVLLDGISTQILDRSSNGASLWIQRITTSFTPAQERNWLIYLLRCSGKTLTAIAELQNPLITRERVRQMEAKISKIVGIRPTDLAEKAVEMHEAKLRAIEATVLQNWITRLGRLPIAEDKKQDLNDENPLWELICGMDLKRRVELLVQHHLASSSAEYDYHYVYVISRAAVGPGYWRDFENLKQFIFRHANALGQPDLMPKQTSFPDSVRGVVTSYGGQGKVAKRIGLQYQGQLVGSDGGRRYWTDERLNQLLDHTNSHHHQDHDQMPSYGQVLDFFSATEIPDYKEKKPHSAIAALTKMGALHWSEVAHRFNKRFISGESQKAVTLGYIKAFVRDLGEHLESLSPAELFVLFQAQGINRGEKEKFSRTFDALVDAVQSGMVDKDELRSWADNNEVESIEDLLNLGSELRAETSIEDKEQKLLERRSQKLCKEFPDLDGETDVTIDDLPTLEPLNILRALDKAGDILDNSATDKDKVEFLKAKAAAKLWDSCFQDEGSLIRKLHAVQTEADSYSSEVQQAFLDEYAGARALPIPPTYAFQDLKGRARDPKLMQRLVAYRLNRDHRLLNLSGTGTGKTLSAIYAAQICGCQRIFISCPNGVIESWRRSFSSAFPTANLIIKPEGWTLDGIIEGVNVVIVNHERFQDRFAQDLLGFCINYQADMIVIDEIHQSKRRTADTSSQRRKLMNEFIRISSNINTDLRVLGLSATPVINNLYEGRSLLELICQEVIDDVGEKIELNACMNLYQHFVVHGIRMNPGQLRRTRLIHQEVDATALLPQIVLATKQGTYHDIEQLLVGPKIASLNNSLVRGEKTVIFLTYIKNTFEPVTRWLAENGYSYSVYTGNEKEAQDAGFRDSLDEFIRGRSEVLVATVQCAGTGIDGLQSVCNRAIFFQLPWTSTEFEQAIGRLDRDGTDFESVSVHIPITDVYLPDGQRWSWCRSKLDRIESKRDIAKAAVDGEIPDAASLISPSDASQYWLKWLEKLNQESQDS